MQDKWKIQEEELDLDEQSNDPGSEGQQVSSMDHMESLGGFNENESERLEENYQEN
jgi:hypothetical protein